MTPTTLATTLRQHGIHPTQQRLAVYEYLLAHRTHPTADTVYQALVETQPTLSRTTVYNTMHALAKAGLIRVITIDADEQRFDADITNHGHFRCLQCGKLLDLPLDSFASSPTLLDGLSVETLDVYLTGRCSHCQA